MVKNAKPNATKGEDAEEEETESCRLGRAGRREEASKVKLRAGAGHRLRDIGTMPGG